MIMAVDMEFCCDTFKYEFELDKYEADGINIIDGNYHFTSEGITVSEPLIYCPYCGRLLQKISKNK